MLTSIHSIFSVSQFFINKEPSSLVPLNLLNRAIQLARQFHILPLFASLQFGIVLDIQSHTCILSNVLSTNILYHQAHGGPIYKYSGEYCILSNHSRVNKQYNNTDPSQQYTWCTWTSHPEGTFPACTTEPCQKHFPKCTSASHPVL